MFEFTDRNSRKLMTFILVPLAFVFGVPFAFVTFLSQGGTESYAVVAGEGFTQREFEQTTRLMAPTLNPMVRRQLSGSELAEYQKTRTLQHLALRHAADEAGVHASNAEIVRWLRSQPAFLDSNGEFDHRAYLRFLRDERGIKPVKFEEILREWLAGQKLLTAVSEFTSVDVESLWREWSRDNRQVRARYALFRADDHRDVVAAEITDEDLQQHLDDNAGQFTLPLRWRVHALAAVHEDFKDRVPQPTEAELRARWEDVGDLYWTVEPEEDAGEDGTEDGAEDGDGEGDTDDGDTEPQVRPFEEVRDLVLAQMLDRRARAAAAEAAEAARARLADRLGGAPAPDDGDDSGDDGSDGSGDDGSEGDDGSGDDDSDDAAGGTHLEDLAAEVADLGLRLVEIPEVSRRDFETAEPLALSSLALDRLQSTGDERLALDVPRDEVFQLPGAAALLELREVLQPEIPDLERVRDEVMDSLVTERSLQRAREQAGDLRRAALRLRLEQAIEHVRSGRAGTVLEPLTDEQAESAITEALVTGAAVVADPDTYPGEGDDPDAVLHTDLPEAGASLEQVTALHDTFRNDGLAAGLEALRALVAEINQVNDARRDAAESGDSEGTDEADGSDGDADEDAGTEADEDPIPDPLNADILVARVLDTAYLRLRSELAGHLRPDAPFDVADADLTQVHREITGKPLPEGVTPDEARMLLLEAWRERDQELQEALTALFTPVADRAFLLSAARQGVHVHHSRWFRRTGSMTDLTEMLDIGTTRSLSQALFAQRMDDIGEPRLPAADAEVWAVGQLCGERPADPIRFQSVRGDKVDEALQQEAERVLREFFSTSVMQGVTLND